MIFNPKSQAPEPDYGRDFRCSLRSGFKFQVQGLPLDFGLWTPRNSTTRWLWPIISIELFRVVPALLGT
ncbi:MAG: hypothetical protein P1S46_12470, partial [bacterium]|nr:hypothetical protein [bacterium]